MTQTRPYFMNNPDWYTYGPDGIGCYLTDKATAEAIESYNKFIEIEHRQDVD